MCYECDKNNYWTIILSPIIIISKAIAHKDIITLGLFLREERITRFCVIGKIMCSVFETIMLVCFGCSWPLNVIKSYKARTARNMSLPFILLIITGYIAGIAAKLISGQITFVLGAYFLNLAIVLVNLFIYFRNRRIDTLSMV